MTAVCLYAAVLLMIASVVVNRIGDRRMRVSRAALAEAEKNLHKADRHLVEAGRKLEQAQGQLAATDERIGEAQDAVAVLERQLDEARQAPVERYFVFDRQETRPGVVWSVTVRRAPDVAVAPGHAALAAAWAEPRTYLVVAGNAREAIDRITQRFSHGNGFVIGNATTSRLFQSRRALRENTNAA